MTVKALLTTMVLMLVVPTLLGGCQSSGHTTKGGPWDKESADTAMPSTKLTATFGVTPAVTVITATSQTFAEKMVFYIGGAVQGDTEGTLSFDGASGTGSGEIRIKAAAINSGIAMRDEYLRGAKWLDTEHNPWLSFKVGRISRISGDRYTLNGTWTIKGKSKTVQTECTMTYISGEAADKAAINYGQEPGTAWIRVQADFNLKLTDFGIDVGQAFGKMADELPVCADLFARVNR